jgi:hypothetical protein
MEIEKQEREPRLPSAPDPAQSLGGIHDPASIEALNRHQKRRLSPAERAFTERAMTGRAR